MQRVSLKQGALLVGLGLLVVVAVWWRLRLPPSSSPVSGKVQVVASFYPLAEFAQQVGGDYVTVVNITPAGAEPHDFDPSPRDMVTLQSARVFLYNGAGLEPWVDRVLPDLQQRGVLTAKASEGIALLPGVAKEGSESAVSALDPTLADPHIWLDPVLAKQEVATIAAVLQQVDPDHAAVYRANAEAYQQQLTELDAQFTAGLKTCQQRDIVTSHAAFGYMAKRYTLNMIALAGLSPDEEPSPQRMARVADFAKTHQVNYIFFETLVSPRLSQTIAHEIGAQTITFNPLEGLTPAEVAAGENYRTVQAANLQHIRLALGCL